MRTTLPVPSPGTALPTLRLRAWLSPGSRLRPLERTGASWLQARP